MHRTHRLLPLMATIVLVASACGSSTTSQAPGASVQPTAKNTFNPVVLPTFAGQTFHIPDFQPAALRWYCCLGSGEDPSQKPAEDKVAAAFAAKYPGSSLQLEITTYNAAVDTLSTQIGPNPPDIAGPVGIGGLASFKGQWSDLTPYLTNSAYDLTVYDPATSTSSSRMASRLAFRSISIHRCSGTSATRSTRRVSPSHRMRSGPSTSRPTGRRWSGTTTRSASSQ